MNLEKIFHKPNATEIEINDGCIKSIWVEDFPKGKNIEEMNGNIPIQLSTGCDALIEFENGKAMLISSSEWCSLDYFLPK